MNYVLDIAAAAVILGCLLSGSKKGAAGIVLSAVGCIAAFAAAVFVSGAYDGYVYDRFVRPAVISAMEKKADELAENIFTDWENDILPESDTESDDGQMPEIPESLEELSGVLTNGEFRDKLNSVFINYCKGLTDVFSGVLSDEMTEEAEKFINEKNFETGRKLELMTIDRGSVIEYIEQEAVRPMIMKIVRSVLFFVTFAAVSAVFAVISFIVRKARGISALRSADNMLGGVLGMVQGIVITAVICAAVRIYIYVTADGNAYINSGIIEKTIFFKWLYSGTSFMLSLILK